MQMILQMMTFTEALGDALSVGLLRAWEINRLAKTAIAAACSSYHLPAELFGLFDFMDYLSFW